jgi:NADH-quinone oxidoreductase subunit K
MSEVFYRLTVSHFLVLAALLFAVGVAGVLLRKNALIVMMSIELMLNAANLTIIAFARYHGGAAGMQGQSLALLVIAPAKENPG